jgi:flavin reductase (DIM6/NTAB) family NADH-FMN oxidoreductase RutF
MSTPEFFSSVPVDKAYRLLNHGPTVLVSSAFEGQTNVMAAAWVSPLDFNPPKVTLVIDKATCTRALVDASQHFVLNLPSQAIAAQVLALGTDSAKDVPDKLQRHGVRTFSVAPSSVPLVHGCVGWLVCKVVLEPRNQYAYDLFIGEVIAAYADARVFSEGRWNFEGQPQALRTLHYVAGGQFYLTGAALHLGLDRLA